MKSLHNMSVPPRSSISIKIKPAEELLEMNLGFLVRKYVYGGGEFYTKVLNVVDMCNAVLDYVNKNKDWYKNVKHIDKYIVLWTKDSIIGGDCKFAKELSDFNQCLYIYAKTVNGFYIPNKEINITPKIFDKKYYICCKDFYGN